MDSDANVTVVPKKGGIDPLNFVLDRLKSFGALVTAIVGLASTLFACSADNIKRNDAFVADVAGTEKQWQSLYDQFFAALGSSEIGDVKAKKLLAICQFTDREVPKFDEHKLGYFWLLDNNARQIAAHDQIAKLKGGLTDTLAAEGIVRGGTRCEKVQEEDESVALADSRPRVTSSDVLGASAKLPSTTPQQATTALQQTRVAKAQLNQIAAAVGAAPPSITLSAGSAIGYDIDIFWCRGAGEDERLKRGTTLAKSLSSLNGNKLPGGTPIGRVRLRPLSAANQANPGYPSSGFQVRGEASEIKLASELAAFFTNKSEGATFVPYLSKTQTRWYLSAFVCS